MAFAPRTELDTGRIKGSFKNSETNVFFEFSEPKKDEPLWDAAKDYPLKLWVGGDEFRWARILQTVAYVVRG